MHDETIQSPPTGTEGIAAEHVDGQGQLVATKDFEIGDQVLYLEGDIFEQPSRFSVQVGPGQHVDLPAALQTEPPMDRYLWRFLNHSCEPNAMVVGRKLIATRPIGAGDEITFDYNRTEDDLATPFECQCGSGECCGVVRGRRWVAGDGARG